MKLSNPLSLILMTAASSDVSGSKSGKGGGRLANGEDYEWAVGNYTECQVALIQSRDGEPFGAPLGISDQECVNREELVIERLGDDPNGLTFQGQGTFQISGGGQRFRYIYEGVGSFNPKYKGEIMFYNDHTETLVDGTWVTLPGAQESDVSTMRVSQLDGDTTSVVADVYRNVQNPAGFQLEVFATYLFTDINSE